MGLLGHVRASRVVGKKRAIRRENSAVPFRQVALLGVQFGDVAGRGGSPSAVAVVGAIAEGAFTL
ncbi:hypothetical protein ACFQE1_20395, partial [Halobium palmae]